MTKLAKAQEKIMNIKLSSTRLDLFPKLDKAQEKRFDKKFDNCLLVNKKQVVVDKESQHISWDELKQHLAKELSLQKKEIIEKLPALWAEHRAEVSHAMEYGTKKDIPNFFQWVKTKL